MSKISLHKKIIALLVCCLYVVCLLTTFSGCGERADVVSLLNTSKVYDGQKYVPSITLTSNNACTVAYALANETDFSETAPITAGFYDVKVTTGGGNGYKTITETFQIEIEKRPASLTGISIQNKAYDGTTLAQIKGQPQISNSIGGDDVNLSLSGTANFSSSEIGSDIAVNLEGFALVGIDAENYQLVYPALRANIIDPQDMLAVNYHAGSGGFVEGSLSQLVELGGSTAPVTAVAYENYYFDKWSDGITSETRYEPNVTRAMSFTALFKPVILPEQLDLFIIAGQSNSVGYTGSNSASLDVLNSQNYPENIFEYRPSLNNIQKLKNPVGEGVSAAGGAMGYTTGGTWFSSMAKAYNAATGKSVVILPAGNPGVTTSTYYKGADNFNMLMSKYNSFIAWFEGQEEYTLGKIMLVWHQGESGTGDANNMNVATKKVFDDIEAAIEASNGDYILDQVFFSRISNNDACSNADTKLRNSDFLELDRTTGYVLVAPNTMKYYWFDQFADVHHYDMNACNDFGKEIGQDIAYYYLNSRTKPSVKPFETNIGNFQTDGLTGLNVTSNHLIHFSDSVENGRNWYLSSSLYQTYAEINSISLNGSTNFELSFSVKLGDKETNVSGWYPVLGSADGFSSISVGANSFRISGTSGTISLAHSVSPIIKRGGYNLTKANYYNYYKIVKTENTVKLFVNNVETASETWLPELDLDLDLFGKNLNNYLDGIISDFKLIIA